MNHEIYIAVKLLCLLMAIVYLTSNVIRGCRNLGVSGVNMWLMSIGIVGFVTLQWELWK